MKITKRQLRRIIREEKQKLLQESSRTPHLDGDDMMDWDVRYRHEPRSMSSMQGSSANNLNRTTIEDQIAKIDDVVDALLSMGMDRRTLSEKLRQIAEDIETI